MIEETSHNQDTVLKGMVISMKKIVKKLALALSLLLLVSPFMISCADTGNNNGDDNSERSGVFASLPNYNFKGETFTFLSNTSTYSNARNCFDEDEVMVGTIDQAIYERNIKVASAFNVKFEEYYENSVDDVKNYVDELVMAQDTGFDVVCIPARYMLNLAAKNYLYSYDELDNIDLNGDAWIKWVNDIIEINNDMYFAFSDAMLSIYDFTHMLLFNQNVLKRYNLTSPYEYIDNDTWTVDNMYMMMRKVSNDLNGDGKYTEEDMYGYTCAAYQVLPNFWVSAGENTVEKKARGYFVFNLDGDQRFLEIYTRTFEMFRETNVWYNGSDNTNRYYDTDLTFQTNHALFADHTFYSISQLRDMESDFGVVPYPKWDSSQDEYYARIEAGSKTWGVMYMQDPKITGTIIEAMALQSHAELIHTYYDITLQLKLTRDDKSIEMLDLIRNSMAYDPGDTIFCTIVRDGMFKDAFLNNKRELSSLLGTYKDKVSSDINEINKYFMGT